jgi:hypothetical protein
MLKKIFTNRFVISGVVVFLILLGVFVYALGLSWGESLLACAVLTLVGVGIAWWQDFWPW